MSTNPDRLMRRPEVLARTGLSKTSLYSLIAKCAFPAPVQIGPRAVAWKESAISDWIAGRKAMRLPKSAVTFALTSNRGGDRG